MRIACCILLLLLAGCQKGPNETIRISSYPGVMEFFPIYLADQLSHFREEGLNVALVDIFSGSKVIAAAAVYFGQTRLIDNVLIKV